MGLTELAAKHWEGMQTADRKKLLRELELTAHDLDGYTVAEASETADFNSLPLIVRGCLITAVTLDGFSVEERLSRVEKMRKSRD
ncbi:MAG: hypothetical protein HYW15_03530 [Candidatus Giovannonibacteria bacterium]|nr:MAG: hypothetical protein HYW15_03530 [Candidatus Giovannonibacteria bacterium]